MKIIKSSVRNDIMLKIVESYRDKNVSKLNDGSFNIMTAFSKTDMKYSEFLEIVRFLESKGFVIYVPADKSSPTYNIRGEEIRQDFIQLTDLGKTYPEDTKSEKINFVKTTIVSGIIAAIIGILLSTELLNWLLQKLLSFLSLLHF